MINDFNPVEGDPQMMSLTIDHHVVPLTRFFGQVGPWAQGADDSSVIVMTHLLIGFTRGIKNLAFNPGLYRIFRIPNSKKYPAISLGRIFVFQFEDEITKFFFRDQIISVSLPTFLIGFRFNQQRSILLRKPVTSGLPTA